MPNYLQAMAGRLGSGMGIDPRRRMAQQLMAQGMDTSPAHVGTGIGRLGKALAAAFMMRQSQDQEAAAMEWLTGEVPEGEGRTRQPTETEAYAADPALRNLQALGARAEIPGFDLLHDQPARFEPLEYPSPPQPVDTDQFFPNFPQKEVDVDPDDAIGPPPESLKTVAEIVADPESEPVQRQFAPTRLPSTSDQIGDDRIQEETLPREATIGRDYAQELARGTKAYQADPANQISDPRTRMEWLRESYRNNPELQNNWFVMRMLKNLMFTEIARGDEEKLYQRGLSERTTAADLKYQRGREGKSPAQLKDIKTEYGYKKEVEDAKRGDYGGAGGMFGGSREGILLNILHSADPSSKEYLMAYTETASERVKTDMHGNTIRVSPDMTLYAKPTYKGTATPAGAVPEMETIPEVGAGVVPQEVPESIPGQATVTRDQSPREGFALEDKLRKEYDMGSKDYVSIRDAYARVVASGKDPSPAGDLALIFNYMKILDPGSVVRESEFAQAAATGSFGERIRAAMGRIQLGQRLSQVMRDDFISRARVLYEQQQTSQTQLENKYKLLAEQYDLDPNRVVIGKKRVGGFHRRDGDKFKGWKVE